MPIKPDASVWGALLAACRNCGNLELIKEVAQRLYEIEPENSGSYVLLSNIYAYHGKLEEATEVRRLMGCKGGGDGDWLQLDRCQGQEETREVRRLMGCKGVRKETGCSWIDVKDRTYVFMVHYRSHSRTKEIYEMLREVGGLGEGGAGFMVCVPADKPACRLADKDQELEYLFGLPCNHEAHLRNPTARDCYKGYHPFADGSCSCGD